MNNTMQMIKMLTGKMSPKDIAMSMLKNNSNPVFKNLLDMANNNETEKLEQFARNICKEKRHRL